MVVYYTAFNMAMEADDSNGLEVDNSYHNVVNSWFPDVEKKSGKHFTKLKDGEKVEMAEGGKKNSKNKRKSLDTVIKDEPKTVPNSTGVRQIPPDMSSFLNEKLTKKLKKNKRKNDEKAEDQEVVSPTKKKSEDQEDSKIQAINQLSKSSDEEKTPHSIESLKQRLQNTLLSQSVRKRLNKRLNKMLNESTDRKNSEALEKGASPEKAKLKREGSDSQVHFDLPIKKKKTGLDNSQKPTAESESSEDENPKKDSSNQEEKPVKKRQKKRSKQKNIKKDNRPEHLKPAHLQNLKKEEETESNSVEKEESSEVSKILKTETSKLSKKDGKKTKNPNKGNPANKVKDSNNRQEAHSIDSIKERLKSPDLSKSTRKRLMRRLHNLENPGYVKPQKNKMLAGKVEKKEITEADEGDNVGVKAKKRAAEESEAEISENSPNKKKKKEKSAVDAKMTGLLEKSPEKKKKKEQGNLVNGLKGINNVKTKLTTTSNTKKKIKNSVTEQKNTEVTVKKKKKKLMKVSFADDSE